MKVILLQDVPTIGKKYDVKDVASGYASNYLFPRKYAEIATDKKIKKLEEKRKRFEAEHKVQQNLLAKNLDSLNKIKIEIQEKTNDQGHLFKGIHKEEIVKAVAAQAHIHLTVDSIVLEQPIKEVGEFPIKVTVDDSSAVFTLVIEAQKA